MMTKAVKVHPKLLLGAWLIAVTRAAYAQSDAASPRPVVLNLVADDSAGQPVADLAASDLTVYDEGKPQHIVSLRLNQSDKPSPLVVLFDLLNAGSSARGAVWNAIKTSFVQVPAGVPLYLYLLTGDGSIYPVHALPAPGSPAVADSSWTRNIEALLDTAMQKVSQVRPADFQASSPDRLPARFMTTYKALANMRPLMSSPPGPKALLWMTYGVPSSIRMTGAKWFDGTAYLRELGAAFVRSGITVYTADQHISVQNGMLDRDTLDALTGSTGGREFSTVSLSRAIEQIEADARTNYSVAFEPSTKRDGKYHKLRVTVARKGVHVQTELGYYAVAGS